MLQHGKNGLLEGGEMDVYDDAYHFFEGQFSCFVLHLVWSFYTGIDVQYNTLWNEYPNYLS